MCGEVSLVHLFLHKDQELGKHGFVMVEEAERLSSKSMLVSFCKGEDKPLSQVSMYLS